jgi:Lrp/AsnC family transcriptional regulator, leucine-responsive regulatory protein
LPPDKSIELDCSHFKGTSMSEPDKSDTLDRIDAKILRELSLDGRIPITELAKKVGLSKSPCQVRMKRLQDQGYVQGFRAVLNPAKLGLDHVAFAEVRLTDTTEKALSAFNAAVLDVPEIEQCHMIAGSFDYLLKIRSQDIKAYRQILGEVISALPYVGSTSTHVSMQAVKDSAF